MGNRIARQAAKAVLVNFCLLPFASCLGRNAITLILSWGAGIAGIDTHGVNRHTLTTSCYSID
ncbi:hypothetical protein [Moorena sp. SIO4G3]|uniref:hypothetical protein n=1 Tax=Moorena sp. SIO4G3 TaxID=2607821 RepID=UPI00142927FA|nr:hypothetical protein [Moorena sp. SIO4G3]NEO76740.1 hypothetical protein [Moorena sp. SIO4G3]